MVTFGLDPGRGGAYPERERLLATLISAAACLTGAAGRAARLRFVQVLIRRPFPSPLPEEEGGRGVVFSGTANKPRGNGLRGWRSRTVGNVTG